MPHTAQTVARNAMKEDAKRPRSCCICLDGIGAVPLLHAVCCRTCREGILCADCADRQLDIGDISCPVCREPIKYLQWYSRIGILLQECCSIGLWWISGFILMHNADPGSLWSKDPLLLSWGCLLVGTLGFHWIGLIIYGITTELDEHHVAPLARHGEEEEAFEARLAQHEEAGRGRCRIKRSIHAAARALSYLHQEHTITAGSLPGDPDPWSFRAKIGTILLMPLLFVVWTPSSS